MEVRDEQRRGMEESASVCGCERKSVRMTKGVSRIRIWQLDVESSGTGSHGNHLVACQTVIRKKTPE